MEPMGDRRPIDGFQDVYEWPYEFRTDFSGIVDANNDFLDDYFHALEPWTYNNHWTFVDDPATPRYQWVVDYYWYEYGGPRGQMPPFRGDEVSEFITEYLSQDIHVLIWNNRYFMPGFGWRSWENKPGFFVDHVHVEWKSEGRDG